MSNWMVGIVSRKNQKKWSIVLLSFVVLLFFVFYLQEPAEMINYKDELNDEYTGIVLEKYIDASDHSVCKLKLKSGNIVSVWDNCYEKVNPGDSIVKKRGSFDFVIYKPSGAVIVVSIKKNLISPKN
ncbi:hypothetical protein [Flavobacterium sp. N502540]|uniref:hypothetical protein n=1 Tax=Flavobacterium sp. N502540 TaxID=2986838 RepID=UPI0022255BED|nr:hypothetical protein [Flavobacterium sp. N502540]